MAQLPDTQVKKSRYARALESAPGLLEALGEAAQESLSLRDEVATARTILGETVRMMARATAANDGVLPQSVAQLVLSQMREVNSLVQSCAQIEAKRQDQALDAAKVALLLGRLRDDLRRSLVDSGHKTAVAFVDAAFARARWTGALDEAAVQEALAAPASFDIKFRPIERDEATGKLKEHALAFDTAEEALADASDGVQEATIKDADLDLTARSKKMEDARALQPMSPLHRVEADALTKELEAANHMLDQDIDEAKASGQPLPGVTEARASKLDKEAKRLLEERG